MGVERRCKVIFFEIGTERCLGSAFSSFLQHRGVQRRNLFIGLTFPKNFDFHKSPKVTAERIRTTVSGKNYDPPLSCWIQAVSIVPFRICTLMTLIFHVFI
ncbi:unnamed protein product [Choristocarpus tenellus]